MTSPILKSDLAAIVSFEDSEDKLRSCLQSLNNWVPSITVVIREGENTAKKIIDELHSSACIHTVSTTLARWEFGLSQINARWILLMRSNEVITGQLRKTIAEKIKTSGGDSCKYPLPTTIVFLKKRLKYPLDWHDSQQSWLACLPQNANTINQLEEKHAAFDGELIHYGENTLSDCANTVVKKAEERATCLARKIKSPNFCSLLIRGFISSIKIFSQAYFLKKGFKEGFEGAAFAICDAHAELLGYFRYHELYVRDGKNLRDNLSSLNKILVIKLRDIGDNILCTPLIHNLKYHLPKTSISVLTWSYSKAAFENNPQVDNLFSLAKEPSRKDVNKLLNQLNSFDFDLVISTHSGGLSSNLLRKIKTKYRINNYYRGRNKSYNLITQESDYYRSAIERDLDCLRSLGLEPNSKKTEILLTDKETHWARDALKAKGLDPSKKTILIHPTAAVSIREWPLEKFNQLIRYLDQNKNTQPIVICTEAEYARVKTLLNDIPDLVIFHNVTVRQMMAIVKECDLVIDNDSSPSHVATAFGIPTVVLFSQAIRAIFRPYNPVKDHHFVFYKDVDCRECELTHCIDRICLDFSPDEVFAQALEMLSCKNN